MKGCLDKMNEIPIFLTIDQNYVPFAAAALCSAVRSCDKERKYRAIVLHQDLTDESISRLESLGTDNFIIELTPMKANFDALDDRMSNRLRCDYFTLTIYFRLFIARMFPQYDKGIYIDSDVILTGDIGELYDTDIGDNFIGACNDLSIADVPPLVAYTENAVGVKKNEYINSGVLVMNLKKMRESGFEQHFLQLLSTYHFDCIAPDQDYINAICNGKIYYLDERWNAMPNDARKPLTDTMLIHYNLFSKPWCYDDVQYSSQFWENAILCGYLDEIKEYKAGYTDFKKKADSECLELLIKRGTEIPLNEITFKKLHEKGVKIRL
ncbi:MAG: glycosyltransferase family 8 protein [Clostridia bacterium]|nr:glycosyltransferase family 8 protein [Clostridia bacterium]